MMPGTPWTAALHASLCRGPKTGLFNPTPHCVCHSLPATWVRLLLLRPWRICSIIRGRFFQEFSHAMSITRLSSKGSTAPTCAARSGLESPLSHAYGEFWRPASMSLIGTRPMASICGQFLPGEAS